MKKINCLFRTSVSQQTTIANAISLKKAANQDGEYQL